MEFGIFGLKTTKLKCILVWQPPFVAGWWEVEGPCASGPSPPSGPRRSGGSWPQPTLPAPRRDLLSEASAPLEAFSPIPGTLHRPKRLPWLRLPSGSFWLSAPAPSLTTSSSFHICRTNSDFSFSCFVMEIATVQSN